MAKAIIGYPFKRTGPGRCACLVCDWSGSTNALARRSHLDGKRHQAAKEAKAERDRPKVDPLTGERPGRLTQIIR